MSSIPATLREWLATRDWGLALSAGYFGFFAHAGVVSVLEQQNLLPTRLSGASAGALVAGFWAAGLPAREISRELLALSKQDFWDPSPGPGLIRGRKFDNLLREALPARGFNDCRTPLTVSVFDLLTLRTRAVQRGALAPAIRASCAVPVMFHPVLIGLRPAVDGGVTDRPAVAGMPVDLPLLSHFLIPQPLRRPGLDTLPAQRENTVFLAFDDLPCCGPNRLHYGVAAFHMARRLMHRALDAPVAPRMLIRRHA